MSFLTIEEGKDKNGKLPNIVYAASRPLKNGREIRRTRCLIRMSRVLRSRRPPTKTPSHEWCRNRSRPLSGERVTGAPLGPFRAS